MDTDRVSRLTEKQRVCLRMVLMHHSSKEIARELGVGADAVDQRLKTAMRTLGVESRVEAARMLARHEGTATYQQFVYQTSEVVPDESSPIPAPWMNHGANGVREPAVKAVREEQAYFAASHRVAATALPLPLPIEGDARNGLGTWQRVGWIVAIAIGTAIGFGAFLSGLEA